MVSVDGRALAVQVGVELLAAESCQCSWVWNYWAHVVCYPLGRFATVLTLRACCGRAPR